MSLEYLENIDSAVRQVLAIRQRLDELQEVLSVPVHQGTTQFLQDLNACVNDVYLSWGPAVAPALAAAFAGATKDTTEDKKSGLHGQITDSKSKRPLNVDDSLIGFDKSLDQRLMASVQTWQHIRKRQKTADTGPRPSSTELQQVAVRVRAACPGMQLLLVNSSGSLKAEAKDAIEVRVHYPKVLTASVALAAAGTPHAVRVAIDAPEKLTEGVAWGSSPHHVFKRMSAMATRALSYYNLRATISHELRNSETGLTETVTEAASAMTCPAGDGLASTTPALAVGATPGIAGTPPLPAHADAVAGGPTEASAGANQAHQQHQSSGGIKQEALASTAAALRSRQPASNAGTCNAAQPVVVSHSPQGVALEDLLLWLSSYRDVFTRPCAVSRQIMSLEPPQQLPVPPIFRPFTLTRAELLDLASDASAIRAYHTHMAPQDLLGWNQPPDLTLDEE